MRFEEDVEQFAHVVNKIARELITPRSVSDALNRITHLAVETLQGCDHAGVLLVRPGRRVESVAATDELVKASSRAQGDLGEGPCFDAARQDQSYRIIDIRSEKRWPRYAPRARELGVGAMMGIQLFADTDSLGALDLYFDQPYSISEKTEELAWIFASHAAVALAASRGGDELQLGG